jgi:hypothetical protein
VNRSRRLGRVGGLAVSMAAAAPFACLWALQVGSAKEPPTAEVRLDMALWMAVFGTPWVIAAQLLWRSWWRQAGASVSGLDGPGWWVAWRPWRRPVRAGLAGPGGRRAGAGRRGRLCRVPHLVRGRVPLDPPWLPADHLGHPAAGDGGGPGGGPGRLPVADAAAAALAAPRPARPALRRRHGPGPCGRLRAELAAGTARRRAGHGHHELPAVRRAAGGDGRLGGGGRGRPVLPHRAVGVRLGQRAGRAADRGRLAGRGAALVPAGRRAAPGR